MWTHISIIVVCIGLKFCMWSFRMA